MLTVVPKLLIEFINRDQPRNSQINKHVVGPIGVSVKKLRTYQLRMETFLSAIYSGTCGVLVAGLLYILYPHAHCGSCKAAVVFW